MPPPSPVPEDLCPYHAQLDRLNDLFNPDPDSCLWTPDTILSHKRRWNPITGDTNLCLKVKWPDADAPRRLLSLQTLRMDQPWICIRYAFHNKLLDHDDWNWAPAYLESDDTFCCIIHSYLVSALNGLPYGYTCVPYHIIYACKVDGCCKACLVIDGNWSPPIHKEDCFAPAVSVEAIRLGFLLAQLHGLEYVAGDVSYAFLTSYTNEKTLHHCRPQIWQSS